MNAFTKIFVLLLVVTSLLSSAGFIVFVNQVQNFKSTQASQAAAITQKDQALSASKTQVSSLLAQLDAAHRDADAAERENTRLAADATTKQAELATTIADYRSKATIAGVTMDNLTASLTASETLRKSQGDALASARTETDRLNKVLMENEVAISDLTSKNEVVGRKFTDATEQLAQSKADNDRYLGIMKEKGIATGETAGTISRSAPAINGVVRDSRPINGIPYATISVGSAEQVQKGMVFNVIDRAHGKFLGELTVDSVDLHEATGKLEGPSINDVRRDGTTEVRTQL